MPLVPDPYVLLVSPGIALLWWIYFVKTVKAPIEDKRSYEEATPFVVIGTILVWVLLVARMIGV